MPYCVGATELYYPLESFEKPKTPHSSFRWERHGTGRWYFVTSYFLSRVHNSINPESRVRFLIL